MFDSNSGKVALAVGAAIVGVIAYENLAPLVARSGEARPHHRSNRDYYDRDEGPRRHSGDRPRYRDQRALP